MFSLANPEIPGARVFSTVPFLAPRVHLVDVVRPLREAPPWRPDLSSAVFVPLPGRESELPEVVRRFPGGRSGRMSDRDGSALLLIYERLGK